MVCVCVCGGGVGRCFALKSLLASGVSCVKLMSRREIMILRGFVLIFIIFFIIMFPVKCFRAAADRIFVQRAQSSLLFTQPISGLIICNLLTMEPREGTESDTLPYKWQFLSRAVQVLNQNFVIFM